MKLSEALVKSLDFVSAIQPDSFLISFSSGKFSVLSQNSSLSLEFNCQIDSKDSFSANISFDSLRSIINFVRTKKTDVRLESKQNTIRFVSGSQNLEIPSFEESPTQENNNPDNFQSLVKISDAEALHRSIHKVRRTALKKVSGAVWLDFKKDFLRLFSTNGTMLVYEDLLLVKPEKELKIIFGDKIPGTLFFGDSEIFTSKDSDSVIKVISHGKDFSVTSFISCLNQKFLDADRIINSMPEKNKIFVSGEDAKQSLITMGSIVEQSSKVHFKIEKEKITVSGNSQRGSIVEEVSCESQHDLDFYASYDYWKEVSGIFSGEDFFLMNNNKMIYFLADSSKTRTGVVFSEMD